MDHSAPSTAGLPIDVQAISRAIGFDISQWQETAPKFTPLYAFDWHKAWKGQHPTQHTDLTVQAAAWHGKMVDLQVLSPWSKAWHEPATLATDWKESLRTLIERFTMGLVFLFAAFMAARNLRAGRGDRRGAWRLAAILFILAAVEWVCNTHWVADIGMIQIFTTNAADWFFSAALIWLLYIALEPAVRARWPHAILTWSRVLACCWQDAQVAAHILYGALVGLIIAGFFLVSAWINASHGAIGSTAPADVGLSARNFIADVLGRAHNAAEFGLIVVFAIFCFRAIVLFTLGNDGSMQSGWIDFLFFLAIFTLLVFVLLRLGLVATMASLFFANTLLRIPGAQTLTKPYESAVVTYPALLLIIVIWAFWRTSGQELMNVKAEAR